ncbi:MAG: two component transcriptional regulator, LuxR family [Hyphomicrobiales bacterium]|nr:two component transcriptional regulator, LuxR family [Hyphomicrobiales bacterium]
MTGSIRIGLIDDHPIVMAGIAALLRSVPDVTVVGRATCGADGLVMVAEASPDVVIMDLSLPDLSGLCLAQQIVEAFPAVKLIALTVNESRAYVQPLLNAGARGYVLKRSAADDLVRAVRAVVDGGVYLDPAVAEQALADVRPGQSVALEELSPREESVLRLTAQGFSNKEIAARMDVSVKTIETYRARATTKICLRSRAEIVRYGASRGWLDPSEIR